MKYIHWFKWANKHGHWALILTKLNKPKEEGKIVCFLYTFYKTCNRLLFSSAFLIYSRRIRLKDEACLKTIFCNLVVLRDVRSMVACSSRSGQGLPLPRTQDAAATFLGAGSTSLKAAYVAQRQTDTQRTLAWPVTQTDTDELLPSVTPRYKAHIKQAQMAMSPPSPVVSW